MKYLLLLLLVAASPVKASQYQGKLDIASLAPQTVVDRDFTYGLWRAGAAYQVWHLQNNRTGQEVLTVSGFWETGIDGQNEIYGIRAGAHLGGCLLAAISKVEVLIPAFESIGTVLPPWASKADKFVSLDLGAGYRPGNAHVSALIGGLVTIPLPDVYAWAAGSNGQRGL